MQGRRSSRSDRRYETGAVIHLPKVAHAGGGPDGHYYVILAATIYAPNEDNGQYDWSEHAWVRAATAEEADPIATEIAARDTRVELAKTLSAHRGERVQTQMPATSVVIVPQRSGSTAVSEENVAIVDGVILHQRCGDPDMCDSWYRYVVRITGDDDLLARVKAFIETQSKK